MDSDNDSYHSENEFYYPDEENVLQENKALALPVLKTSGTVFPNTDLPAGK